MAKNTYLEVKDAYTGQPVTARVCLQYSNKKLNECFDMDNSKIPKGLVLPKNDNASITVTAKGFYNYSGNLLPASQDSANALYHIKLLQSQSPVSIFFDGPKNLDISYMFGRNNRFSTEFAFKQGQHIENISLDYINLPVVPGQYEVVVSTGGQKDSTSDELNMEILLSGMKKTGGIVLLTDRFTVSSSLNFKAIHVENPLPVLAANVVHQDDEAKPPFENRTLYFDQSSYLIRSASRLTLDSISEFLRNQRKAKAMITGHTDNVGRRDLNLVLSEYRARVVAHYLKQKGVQPQQISMTYKGPDMPAAPNTDQEKKIKNRRVEIRVGKL